MAQDASTTHRRNATTVDSLPSAIDGISVLSVTGMGGHLYPSTGMVFSGHVFSSQERISVRFTQRVPTHCHLYGEASDAGGNTLRRKQVTQAKASLGRKADVGYGSKNGPIRGQKQAWAEASDMGTLPLQGPATPKALH
jgi:hypothetical protein